MAVLCVSQQVKAKSFKLQKKKSMSATQQLTTFSMSLFAFDVYRAFGRFSARGAKKRHRNAFQNKTRRPWRS
jgi:hypothetical protein